MQHEWMNDTYREAGRYLVRLIKGGLNGTDAGKKPENVSWNQIYAIAKYNGVEGIGYYGLKELSEPPADEVCARWEKDWSMTCYRQLSFDVEREQILQVMFEKGISCLPLKGILLAGYYPEPGMRSMVDNDILYGFTEMSDAGEWRIAGADAAEQRKSLMECQRVLAELMQARGYRVENLKGHHDVYQKEPIFNFEMHRELIAEGHPFYFYYKNPWKNAVQDAEHPFLYSFPDEDEYIYFLVHAFKHYDGSGCGIRFLTDLYVFLKKKGKNLDWEYISGELRMLKLTEFEEQMREISQRAFDEAASLSKEQEEEIFFLMGCGTHGNVETRIRQSMQKIMQDKGNSKHMILRYAWKRMVLPETEYKNSFPFFYRYRLFRPLLPVYRVASACIHRPQNVRTEVTRLLKMRKTNFDDKKE